MHLGVQCISKISTINGDSFVLRILEGNTYQLNYNITLTKMSQEKHQNRKPKVVTYRLIKRLGL